MFYENFNLRLRKLPENKACPDYGATSKHYVTTDDSSD
jgi:hypothetical protein